MQTPLQQNLGDGTSQAKIPEIQEIAISISANNLNPTILSEDFLKLSGIVPSDWELRAKPTLNPRLSQLSFKSGVNVVAQPGTISFTEGMNTKQVKELQAAEVACKYVAKLSNAEYQGLAINVRTLVPLLSGPDAARSFIADTLLAPGPWKDFGKEPLQAGINLFYQLDDCQLTLSINQAKLQPQDKPAIPALLFSGSFNYNLGQYSGEDRLQKLAQLIRNWSKNIETFRELIDRRFLKREESVFPTGAF
jgi:hypothetical protein